jgi:hypothetical protein
MAKKDGTRKRQATRDNSRIGDDIGGLERKKE